MHPAASHNSERDRPEENPDGILEVCCPGCLRQYRIRRSRIPAGASAVRCKECRHKIPLFRRPGPPAKSSRRPPARPDSVRPRFRLDLMTPEKRRVRRRFTEFLLSEFCYPKSHK
jgi:predicted Zn finger-like uncharacterized protein